MSALAKALVALVAMAAVAELAAAKNHTIRWSASGNYGDWSASNAVSVGDSVGELLVTDRSLPSCLFLFMPPF
jgi:hypothetical protein